MWSDTLFVIYAVWASFHILCEGATFNDVCDSSNSCTFGTSCQGGKCLCGSTSYWDGNSCQSKVGLGSWCVITAGCITPNSVCSANACTCDGPEYQQVGLECYKELGYSCVTVDDCADYPTICKDGDKGPVCTCVDTHYDTNTVAYTGGDCELQVGLGGTCPFTEACATLNAICSGGTCTCEGAEYQQVGSECYKDLGFSCVEDDDCADNPTICKEGDKGHVCTCRDTHYDTNGAAYISGECKLRVGLGEECPFTEACLKLNSICSAGTCQCNSPEYQQNGLECYKDLGFSCVEDDDCADKPTICKEGDKGRVCTCKDTQYDTNGAAYIGGECKLQLGLESSCTMSEACGTLNAICSSGKCTCASTYQQVGAQCEKASDTPLRVEVTEVTSRSIAFKWVEQAKSDDRIGFVVQVKTDGNQCVEEKIYRCSDCTKTFQVNDLQDVCNTGSAITERSKDQLADPQTYMADSLLPDTLYTISVTGIYGSDEDFTVDVSQKTKEEVPAVPNVVSITEIDKWSFRVNWDIAGPRPGETTFVITVTTDEPAEPKEIAVVGFEMRTEFITGLEEYWPYQVFVTARTAVGSKTSPVSDRIRTLPDAPGVVSDFNVDMRPDNNNNYWKVSWKIPAVLERNSIITNYIFKHVGISESNEKDIPARAESFTYEETISVVPESYHTVEVWAVNDQGQDGASRVIAAQALAPVPAPPVNEDFEVFPDDATVIQRTTITITIKVEFLELTSFTVRDSGLIGCSQANCDFSNIPSTGSNGYGSISLMDFGSLPSWYTASKTGFTLWRISNELRMTTRGRRKRDTAGDIPFTIGSETCNNPNDTGYCNGPLAEDTAFIFRAVVCTNGGCLVSGPTDPLKTLEGSTSAARKNNINHAMIYGVLYGLLVLLKAL